MAGTPKAEPLAEMVEVDDETLAALKEEGLDIKIQTEDAGTTPAEEQEPEVELVSEEETDATPEEETQEQPQAETPEETVDEPEFVTIDGKRHTVEDIDRSRKEAERKITELGQELGQLRPIANVFQQLSETKEGQELLKAALFPAQPQKQPEFAVPETPEEYIEMFGSKPHKLIDSQIGARLTPFEQRTQRLEQTLNAVLGMLEEKEIENKYGDLAEYKDDFDVLAKRHGGLWQQYPLETRIELAKGRRYDMAQTERQTQTVTEQDKARHRAKVLAEPVETARTTGIAPKVIDPSEEQDPDKYLAKLKEMGINIRRIERE